MNARQTGFTLVELLVVMAIMSMLAALLLPGLEKSLAQARLISCASNIKQLGIGVASYASECNDTIPPSMVWAWWPSNYASTATALGTARPDLAVYGVEGGKALNLPYLYPLGYVESIPVFYCPTAQDAADYMTLADWPTGARYSYHYNLWGTEYIPVNPAEGDGPLYKKLTNYPTDKVMISDRVTCYEYMPYEQHDHTYNRLYPDCHANATHNTDVAVKFLSYYHTFPAGAYVSASAWAFMEMQNTE